MGGFDFIYLLVVVLYFDFGSFFILITELPLNCSKCHVSDLKQGVVGMLGKFN